MQYIVIIRVRAFEMNFQMKSHKLQVKGGLRWKGGGWWVEWKWCYYKLEIKTIMCACQSMSLCTHA